LSQQAQNKFRK